MVSAAITGLGVVSVLGHELDSFFAALATSQGGGRRIDAFAEHGMRRSVAAMIEREPVLALLPQEERGLPWASAIGVVAARAALADAGREPTLHETPLVVACSIGSPGVVEEQGRPWGEIDLADHTMFFRYGQGVIVALLASALGARGPVSVLTTTCAAGNYALGAALDALEAGADWALVGGTEELSTLPYAAFNAIRAVSDHSRPFDENRDGLLFGEGAAFAVLERSEVAAARGARVYAQLLGVGFSNDAHNLVAPHPEGHGAELALRRAIAVSGMNAADVGYINAHGTGTELNDSAEARAVCRAFGRSSPPISSTKGATGHCMGAASAIEAVITALALHRETLPPTAAIRDIDDSLDLDIIAGAPRHSPVKLALSSGFGFGGNNAVAAFGRDQSTPPGLPRREVYVHGAAVALGGILGLEAFGTHLARGETMTSAASRRSFDRKEVLGRKGLRKVDSAAILLAAALETDLAQWPAVPPDRAGAVVGSSVPAFTSVVELMNEFQHGGPSDVNPALVPFATANCAPSWWLKRRGITGFNGHLGSGDCAGLDAIGYAAAQIRHGRVDALVAGGVEAYTEELWKILSEIGRTDPPPTEAAGLLSLSCEPQGAWARVAGWASRFDATDPDAAASRAARAVIGDQPVDLVITTDATVALGESWSLAEVLGDCLGATGGLLAVAAALRLRDEYSRVSLGTAPVDHEGQRFVVCCRSWEGYGSALLLERG